MIGNSAARRLAHLRPELALLRAWRPLGCRREAACGSLSRRRPRRVGTCASAGVSGWPDNTNGPSKVVIGRGASLAEDRRCGGQRGPLPAAPAPPGQRQRECALRDLRTARDPEVTAREAVPLGHVPRHGPRSTARPTTTSAAQHKGCLRGNGAGQAGLCITSGGRSPRASGDHDSGRIRGRDQTGRSEPFDSSSKVVLERAGQRSLL